MILGTDLAVLAVAVVTCLVVFVNLGGFNLPKILDDLLKPLAIPLILIWLVFNAGKRVMVWVGFLATGLFGYVVLHHPQLAGNEHALAPMMAGLFGVPIMLHVLTEREALGIPEQAATKFPLNVGVGLVGVVIGCISGFFAGLGSGSLVCFFGDHVAGDEEYLLMSSASEAANDLLAVLLVLTAGMARSGEAVMLGRVIHDPGVGGSLLVMAMVAISAAVGRYTALGFEKRYSDTLQVFSGRFWAVLVISIALWQVWLVGHPVIAFSLTGAGVCLSMYNRGHKLPLQVSFAGLALPLVIQGLGLAPGLDTLLFGT